MDLLDVGKSIFIRTVTHYYTGEVVYSDATWVVLTKASWVAHSGRWTQALASGNLSEVEPYPGKVSVSLGAVVDISEWMHKLPDTVVPNN